MKILFILFFILISGCANSPDYGSMQRAGAMYHYSGNTKFTCSKCFAETNLYRLDNKNKVICKKCFIESKNKGNYH